MEVRDVTGQDLWVPSDIFRGAALRPGWVRRTARIDLRLERERDHMRRVLAAGERCAQDFACIPSNGCPDCNGTGYTRQPYDLGRYIDAEIAGRITPQVAAAAGWAHTKRIEMGLRPLVGIEGPWTFRDNGRDEWERKKIVGNQRGAFWLWGKTCGCGCGDGPGWAGGEHNDLMSPCKGADDGKRRADKYALVGGHALLNDGELLLPMGYYVARLALTPSSAPGERGEG